MTAIPHEPKKKKRIDCTTVNGDLIGLELQAFAELFHHWAADDKLRQEPGKNRERLDCFRKALLGSEYGTHREDVPHELVYDEYQLARHAVEQVRKLFEGKRIKKKELEDYEVLYSIEGGGAIRKTWPISPTPTKEKYSYSPEDLAEDILDRTEKSPDTAIIARRIVGARFGYSEEAVKKKCNKKKQRHERETRTDWRLLATIFLELGSHGKRKLQARVLDCLLSSGYSRFKLYYLVQISHSLDKPISFRPFPADQAHQLCRLVCPELPTGPFSQLPAG